MENSLAISSWVWWALAAACLLVPILIHLLQLYRHQPIRWAAMSFLIRSQKRSRKWIRFKQWLLIASRMALLLLGLLLFSQIRCDSAGFENYLGGGRITHHLVLLDDSYSMEERQAGVTARDRGRDALEQLIRQLEQPDHQRLSLMTFSAAHRWTTMPGSQSASPEKTAGDNLVAAGLAVDNQVVTRELADELLQALQDAPPSFGSANFRTALEWFDQYWQPDPTQNLVVHVISDFRQADWNQQASVWDRWRQEEDRPVKWNLIDCGMDASASEAPNLAITDLRTLGSLNTTRTGYQVELEIQNRGSQDAQNVVVSLEAWQHSEDATAAGATDNQVDSVWERLGKWRSLELPAVLLEKIPAGETVRQSFPVSFSEPGQPVLVARLPDDSLSGDNLRQLTFAARREKSLLVIDDQTSQGSWLLSQSLNPAGMTGVRCRIETSARLRQIPQEELDAQQAIFLLDVPRLDQGAVEKLTRFVAQGGGLVWFVGPQVKSEFYNQTLHPVGLFPVQLDRPIKTPERVEGEPADLIPQPHPIFQPFLDGDPSQLDPVVMEWIWKVVPDSLDSMPPSIAERNRLANFRDKDPWPLFLEHRLNPKTESESSIRSGKILTFLNPCDGQWNNWPQELTFPALILLMADYVSKPLPNPQSPVGEPLDRSWGTVDQAKAAILHQYGVYEAGQSSGIIRFSGKESSGVDLPWTRLSQGPVPEYFSQESTTGSPGSRISAMALQGPAPQVLDLALAAPNQPMSLRMVTNVDLGESRLERSNLPQLASLPTDQFHYMRWNQMQWESGTTSQRPWLRPLVLGLLAVMVLEATAAIWTGDAG